MSEYDELFDGSEDDTPLVRKLRAQLKEQSQELKKATGELNQIKGAQRQQTLSEAVAAKGLNPKVAKFIPQDLEVSALDEWLAENGDVFGAPPAPAQEPVAPSEGEVKMAQLGFEEEPTISVPADLSAQIAAAKDLKELQAVLGRIQA